MRDHDERAQASLLCGDLALCPADLGSRVSDDHRWHTCVKPETCGVID